jgi:hypothetical protein
MASALVTSLLVAVVSFCFIYFSRGLCYDQCKITDCVTNVSTCGHIPHLYTCYSMEFEYTLYLKYHTYSQRWIGSPTNEAQTCPSIGTTVTCYYYGKQPIRETLNINPNITYARGNIINHLLDGFVLPILSIIFFFSSLSTVVCLAQLGANTFITHDDKIEILVK